MSRINTNVPSQIARRNLSENNKGLNTTLERLSTGLRINRGKDDPAGLIASENLRAEKSALTAAIANAERADQFSNIAEGGLSEISNLLTELRGLVTASASTSSTSAEEKSANQLQIDSILQTIDRLSEATNFQGIKLLNGNQDFTAGNIDAGVSDYRINAAKLNFGASQSVTTTVTTSAQRATLQLDLNRTTISTTGNQLFTIEIAGAGGSREFSFGNGTTVAQAVSAINAFKDVIGVSATANSTSGINLKSTDFGSDQFVSTRVVNLAGVSGANIIQAAATNENNYTGTSVAVAASALVRDDGQDIAGSVNGLVATGRGRTLKVATDFLDSEITLTASKAQTAGTFTAFNITGGGASFQLDSKINLGTKTTLGIQNVAARKLGNSTLGFLSDLATGKDKNVVNGDLGAAAKIVEEAIKQLSGLRGRLGAFQKNVVGSTIRNLGISLENSAAAESVIRDADFASETANLTRGQILSQAGGQSLGLANSAPQAALSLLRG
ncbi:MAG: flagellin [bacterium]